MGRANHGVGRTLCPPAPWLHTILELPSELWRWHHNAQPRTKHVARGTFGLVRPPERPGTRLGVSALIMRHGGPLTTSGAPSPPRGMVATPDFALP